MTQQIAGQLGVRFQELPCDRDLPKRLAEAKKNRVPVILVTDAWSVCLAQYARIMSEYDDLNLLNCAVLVPWNDDQETAQQKGKLRSRLMAVCPQKLLTPPPGHLWDGIQSMDELRVKTAATLDELRMRLLQLMLSEAGEGDVRKAENSAVAATAAAQGIPLDRQPHLQNTSGGPS